MSWFAININNESIIFTGNQGVQKSDLVVIFFFDGKGNVLIDTVERVVERVNCVSFYDAKNYHQHIVSILWVEQE